MIGYFANVFNGDGSANEKSFLQKLRMVMPNIVSKGLMRLEDVSGGEEIFVADFVTSISDEMKLDDGIVRVTKGMDNDATQFIISSDIQKGNSGGQFMIKRVTLLEWLCLDLLIKMIK